MRAAGAVLLMAGVATVAGAGAAGAGGGTTINITNGSNAGPGSYRAAVNAAESIVGDIFLNFSEGLRVNLTNDVSYSGDDRLIFDGGSSVVIDGNGNQILAAPAADRVDVHGITMQEGGTSGDGGAIEVGPDTQLFVYGSTFTGNDADGDGGALAGSAFTYIGESTFTGNSADGHGGAAAGLAASANLQLVNSTFHANTAGVSGGAAANPDGNTLLSQSTLVGNSAPAGAQASGDTLTADATVLSSPQGGGANCAFASTTGDESTYEAGDDSCELTGPTSTDEAPDPQLRPLADYSGPNLTMRPENGSPLIDAYAPSGSDCERPTDQRGVLRPQDGDGTGPVLCDIGAVEARFEAFTDVTEAHQFFEDIAWMADEGISTGFQPGPAYRPGDAVTRQAMSAFMYRLAGSPPFPDPPTATFNDVGTGSTFFTEIEWMADEGITTGFPGNVYKPSQAVSRAAMSAFMYRLAGSPAFADPPTATFNDVATTSQFFTEIEWMADEDITTGFPGDLYKPSQAVTRQAMSAFMHRLADGPGVGI